MSFYDMDDEIRQRENDSDALTTDDYGSGVLYDLIDKNVTTSTVINCTTAQTTGKHRLLRSYSAH